MKTSLSEQEFQTAKAGNLKEIRRVVTDCKMLPESIVNWDQSGSVCSHNSFHNTGMNFEELFAYSNSDEDPCKDLD